MVTLSVDDRIAAARETAGMMESIDPEGTHRTETDPARAIETIKELRPDIVWLDVEMPGKNGLEVSARIKQISPSTNIVFVTGHPEYALDAFKQHVSGFILKPVTREKMINEIENLRKPVLRKNNSAIRVQCFGNFEVFCNGRKMHFARTLSKEALAYLIDRRGAGCTVGEICAVLWEDRTADSGLKAQCRTILGSLKKDLVKAGAGDAIVKSWNTWSIDADKIECDYYDFLRGDARAVNSFRGEYMTQYSWAEMTIGSLYQAAGEYIDL